PENAHTRNRREAQHAPRPIAQRHINDLFTHIQPEKETHHQQPPHQPKRPGFHSIPHFLLVLHSLVQGVVDQPKHLQVLRGEVNLD
ncbi:hypothetical protein AAHH78_35310, partial [Burkholderia pseudomallei]